MKKLILISAMTLAFSASARSILPINNILSANLTEAMNVSQDSPLHRLKIYGGDVKIKQLEKSITLTFDVAKECPADLICTMELAKHSITLPTVKAFVDSCGNTTYIGEKDLRPVDGMLQKVTVRDNTFNKCPTFIALPSTGVIYETSFINRINLETVSSYSTFEADKLVSNMVITKLFAKILPAL